MNRIVVLLFFIPILFSSCLEYEIVEVPDNRIGTDSTISLNQVENYIYRMYITNLGRKPFPEEYLSDFNDLVASKVSLSSRASFYYVLKGKDGFEEHLFQFMRAEVLEGLDTATIMNGIAEFEEILQDSDYVDNWPEYQIQLDHLNDLLSVHEDLESGGLDMSGAWRRCADNIFYDEINMGIENFVVSIFQNFLYRYPTDEELLSASEMVDGNDEVLFLEKGESRDDFLRIFFAHAGYFEGQVIALFRKHLLRDPDSEELNRYTIIYRDHGYYELQKEIQTTDEFYTQ